MGVARISTIFIRIKKGGGFAAAAFGEFGFRILVFGEHIFYCVKN
jgi:hypothetical protein